MLKEIKRIGLLDTLLIFFVSSILLLFLLWTTEQIHARPTAFNSVPQWIIDVSQSFWSYITAGTGGILSWIIRRQVYGKTEQPAYFIWIIATTTLLAMSIWGFSQLNKSKSPADRYEYGLVFIDERTKFPAQFNQPNVSVQIYCQAPPIIVPVTFGTAKFEFDKRLENTMTAIQFEHSNNDYKIKLPHHSLTIDTLNYIYLEPNLSSGTATNIDRQEFQNVPKETNRTQAHEERKDPEEKTVPIDDAFKELRRMSQGIPMASRIFLTYRGSDIGIAHTADFDIVIGGATSHPTVNEFEMSNVPLGSTYYIIDGTISINLLGLKVPYKVYGKGKLNVREGSRLEVFLGADLQADKYFFYVK
jgi:hypothetical protein